MTLTGTLRSWDDTRGFWFIAPANGGRELFVHITAFPKDGSRPTVGETLTYELGRGKDGKPQAVRVFRQALGQPSSYPTKRKNQQPVRRRNPLAAIAGVALLVALAGYGYSKYDAWSSRRAAPSSAAEPTPQPAMTETAGTFRCDGRTHCSQMTSCSEAKFFLAHCPGTAMDGNNDGVPCEQQWCTIPSAK